MSVLFVNNAATTLSAGVGDSATSITVTDGSVFPSLSGSDYFYLTLEVDSDPTLKEIVKCTARSGNTLTITRAQDGTSARTFSTADKAELRLTAAGLNDVATQADTDTTYSVGDGGLTQNNFTDALKTKLDGIEASATADQTAAEIKTAYESNSDTNAFTNADHSKLDGIEASADVTDTTNVSAAGALMKSGGTMTGNLTVSIPDTGNSPAMTAELELKGYEGRGAGIKIQDQINSASGATNREWFVGTGYNQSGFNIGYASDGSQSSYSAQNKLAVSTSGDVTIAGTITSNSQDVGTQSVVTTAPTSASGFPNGHVWYVVS